MTGGIVLVDTSVAIALALADHHHHASTAEAVGIGRLGMAGHAAFETFSVLTRLPAPLRRTPSSVLQLLGRNFPETRYLGVEATTELMGRLAGLRIAGGAIYDALIGAAAVEHRLPLLTRDRRATDTYRSLGVNFELVN